MYFRLNSFAGSIVVAIFEAIMSSEYTGLYVGKVEKRVDPNRQGRLKVRIIGIHNDEINVDQLPWAYPKNNAWSKGGSFKIPPIRSWVYVQFLNGNHEYPVWDGSWWGTAETSEGSWLSEHKIAPTSWFGGNAGEGLLEIDADPDTKPEDQPNNFCDTSVNNKRYEFDDRKGRERAIFADQLDNMLYINTEQGVLTLEAGRGLQNGDYFKQGITFSSHLKSIQMYTFKGWKLTIDAPKGTFEVCAPIGHKFRIETASEDGSSTKQRLELWTNKGNKLIIDEEHEFVILKTAKGKHLWIDDADDGGFQVKTNKGYFCLDDASGDGELFTEGDLKVKVKGSLGMSCEGKLTLDGAQGVFFNEGAPTIPAKGPNFDTEKSPWEEKRQYTLPQNMADLKRALDYPYYKGIDMP